MPDIQVKDKLITAEELKTVYDKVKLIEPSAAFSIPSHGSYVSYNMSGLTSNHELVRWNFSLSPENVPPVDLTWATYNGYFTITNNGGTTAETIKPVFALPNTITISNH